MTTEYCLISTTIANQKTKENLIAALFSKNLAACIQCVPIQSHYMWDGKLQNDSEDLLLIKSKSELYTEIEQLIIEQHNYQTPQILKFSIDEGYSAYLNWIKNVCK